MDSIREVGWQKQTALLDVTSWIYQKAAGLAGTRGIGGYRVDETSTACMARASHRMGGCHEVIVICPFRGQFIFISRHNGSQWCGFIGCGWLASLTPSSSHGRKASQKLVMETDSLGVEAGGTSSQVHTTYFKF